MQQKRANKKKDIDAEYRSIDYKKALLSKPDGLFEQFCLVMFLAVGIAIYFGPLIMSPVNAWMAVAFTIVPAITTGWVLFSLLRVVRYKEKYTKKIDK